MLVQAAAAMLAALAAAGELVFIIWRESRQVKNKKRPRK
jgi:hypothetical protein